jgi:hypothetical protein
MEEKRNADKILVVESRGQRPLEGLRRRLENTLNTDLKERGWEGVDWVHLAQNRSH